MSFVVAIDGPAGAGKGTVAALVAERLGLVNIDTGAMYRCVTLKMIRENVGLDELDKINKILDEIEISFKSINGEQIVFLNGEDVSELIRKPNVNE